MLSVALAWSGTARAATPPEIEPPISSGERATRDAALVVGNEAYTALPQATYATAGAGAFRSYLEKTRGLSRSRLRTLDDANADAIRREARRAAGRVRRGGTGWIYFSGHGGVTTTGERAVLGIDGTLDDVGAGGVTLAELLEPFVRRKSVGRVIVVIDAGFGGVGRDGIDLVPGRHFEMPPPAPPDDDRVVVWLANITDGPAEAWTRAHHGLFTWLVVGALRGWADGEQDGDRDGKVTLEEAQDYVRWTGRRLGRATRPSLETRDDPKSWLVAEGGWLEMAPPAELISILSIEDRERRFAEAEALLRAEASAFWQDTLRLAARGGPEGRAALEAFIEEYSASVLTVDWALVLPEVREARKVLARYKTQGTLAVAEAATEPCDDLVAMEGAAMLGTLTPGQQSCLENRIRADRMQTTREKVSLVLMVNAQSAGKPEDWERLVRRHLEDIGRSDPALCMSFAIYLHQGDVQFGEEAIRWADYALENKSEWEGEEHVKRVSALYRLRAEAAARLWRDAERRFLEERTPEVEAQTRKYRGWTMDHAREWLDYTRAAKLAIDAAYKLCFSAAGTDDFCREGRVVVDEEDDEQGTDDE